MLALLCVLGLCAEAKFTEILVGNWNVTSVILKPDGSEDTESISSNEINFETSTENANDIVGQLMGENEDGVMTPITSIKISQPEIEEQEESENEQKAERVNNKYTVSLASPDTEAFEDLLSFETKQDVDQMFYASGKFADGNIYSLVTLSTHEAELTVYDPSAKTVTLYRLQKPVPVQQTSMMQMLMPMLPMLIMQFMGRPNFAPPQQQGGEGGGEGGAAPAGGAN